MDCFASLAMTALQRTVVGCLKILKPMYVCEALLYPATQNAPVMPGLDPGIHQSSSQVFSKMDHRVKPGDDDFNWPDGHREERSTRPDGKTENPGRLRRPGLLESECKVQINIRRR
jgi:hypothetical protein